MTFPSAEKIEYVTAGTKADRTSGETVEDWSNPVRVFTAEAAVEPRHDGEQDDGYRVASTTGYRLYHREWAYVNRRWRVRVRGEELRIIGRPAEWSSPYSGFEGVVVECEFQED